MSHKILRALNPKGHCLLKRNFAFTQVAFKSDIAEILKEIRHIDRKKDDILRQKQVEQLINALHQDMMSKPLDQPLFIQAVEEVITSIKPFLVRNPKYLELIPLLCVPEQVHMFQVPWVDDNSLQRVNLGYRVQFNHALGPYKGGLRFHKSVDLSVVKFLGFEQIFKNALTGLPIGGGKGGADFDPKGKSQREIFKFCKSFMNQLIHYIGPDKDVPAGDIGVGAREIGYMYGHYNRLSKVFHGSMTGKGLGWGGSHLRPEATGYGLIYITDCHLKHKNDSLENKRCLVSGSGNVAQFAAEKLLHLKAKVLTMSDSNGTLYNVNGFTEKQLEALAKLKDKRMRCKDLVEVFPEIQYYENETPWTIKKEADLAFPCATQNEINRQDAVNLVEMKCKGVFEGANMPSSVRAIYTYMNNNIDYIPAKAANAGGVAVSCLEMAQNSARLVWKREKVDEMLKEIMQNIYVAISKKAEQLGHKGNLQLGANTVGFKRVADAMFQQGTVFRPDT
ncbi:hypothetical protein MHBO_000917 [Bonamia ostreae]|uniref:Glutamate dehydrogenase n=1 Tax=Bonamia ostreae TaxID=126728 RepID=A0ABV2AI43_9EUKA